MVKLYLLALVAAVLVFAPSDVSAVSNLKYVCGPSSVSVSFDASPNHSGKVTVMGFNDAACTATYNNNQRFDHTFPFNKCSNGRKSIKIMVNEVQTIVSGSSSSSSSSSSSQTINC